MATAAGEMKSSARARFGAWAQAYDRSPLNRFLFLPSYRAMLAELVRWDRTAEPFDLLDVGCGTGTFAAMLAGSGRPARVVGLDFVPAMCRLAKDKAEAAGAASYLRFLAGDAEHLPFAAGSFDVVTCSNSFHHYPHQAQAIREMRRVLRPGGRLILVDGFRDNVIGWFVFDVCVGMIEKHVRHVPWGQVRDYFEAAGFVRVRQRKFNLLFPLLLTVGQVPKQESSTEPVRRGTGQALTATTSQ